MRCGCPHCGAFMVNMGEDQSVCVCPDCGYRCNACLGTGTAITREQLRQLKNTEWFVPHFDDASTEDEDSEMPKTSARPDAPEGF